MKKQIKKKRKETWLLLGMVEGKVYCRYMGLHSQRQGQGHLEESRMVMTLSHVGRGGEERQKPGAKPGGQRYKENG